MNRHDRRRLAQHIGRLSPAERQQLNREARARTPLHVADQFAAANKDAREGLARVAAATQQRAMTMEPTPELQARFDLIYATYLTGDLRHCPHIGGSPRVVCLSLWEDDYVYCGAGGCKPAPLDAIEDRTCDLCRRLVRAIHPNVLQTENIIVAFGACPSCHADLLAGCGMSDVATLRAELDQTVRDLEHLRLLVSERKVHASALAVAEYQINCLRRRLGDLGATDHRPPTTDHRADRSPTTDHRDHSPTGRGEGVAANTPRDATDPRGVPRLSPTIRRQRYPPGE